ncbi:type VI secretion system protein TssR domain-containing protein [Pedobacter sp. UYP30]|uniref:type VI secretion system protein TssR domain-containing protein n=1 Tax=Pedobacter sp. UYP30 TaxID=1756400 RepID=UPI003397BE19
MKKIIALIALVIPMAVAAQSPFSLKKKVAKLPRTFENPTDKTNVYDNGRSSSLPWIVFSDRDENYTYTSPGGSLVMKKIHFMEPFYVSKEKDGYLKLVKYQAGMVLGRKLKNKKAAESYGWVSRSKVLLWQSAFVNPQSRYPSKAVTVISGKGPLTMPKFYYDNTDSVYVYNSPKLDKQKAKVALNGLVYVYKKSADGRTVLIGSQSQLLADSASRSVYGWIPADAVHSWGDRLYISSLLKSYSADDSAAVTINKNLKISVQSATNSSGFAFDPLIDRDKPLLLSIPVISAKDANYKSGDLSLGIAKDVYDKSNNRILNIKGGYISYKEYLSLRRNSHKINLVYVVDGGNAMRTYFAGLTSSIQSFENIFTPYRRKNIIQYGSVVYRNNSGCAVGGIVKQPFSGDYRDLTRFLDKQSKISSACYGGVTSQPVFEGIQAALSMFKNHPGETNLIVLVGSTGNEDVASSYLANLASDVASVNARILAVQVFSDYNPLYNNFVIQSRKLVSQSAALLAENKKSIMVSGEGLSDVQQYNTSLTDSVSFYLDYPKNSLIQGGVIFPPKGVVKTNKTIEESLSRFMKETDFDINSQISLLDSAFRLTGREHSLVYPVVLAQLTPSVSDSIGSSMPHNAFKYYLPAEMSASAVTEHPNQLQYLIILNEEEYKQMTDILSLMVGDNLQKDAGSYRRKLVKNYFSIIKDKLNMDLSRGTIKHMTLAAYIQKVTGIPVFSNPMLEKYTVVNLRSSSRMPLPEFETYIKFLESKINTINKDTLVKQYFYSNGKKYYYVTQSNWR